MTAVLPAPVLLPTLDERRADCLPVARSCVICGEPSGDAAECNACVIAEETWWKRASDR